MIAAALNNQEIVKLLLDHGASPYIKNKQHQAATDLAFYQKYKNIVKIINQYKSHKSTY